MIARIAVDISLPHLDRLFDYEVPEKWRSDAVIGARVRVRFSGRLLNGYIVELPEHGEPGVKLRPLERILSPEPVLLPTQVALLRKVADHYAGVFADLVRLAVPPRHASTEKANQREWPTPVVETLPVGAIADSPHGQVFLDGLAGGQNLRAHWLAPARFRTVEGQRDDWITGFIQATVATLRSGRSVIIVVPDATDVSAVRERLGAQIGIGAVAELHSNLGQSGRYRNYLAISRGQAKVVVGTRAAVYAPIHDLGLIALWDDGDDLLAEPHAPYPHARDVAALRASMEPSALLFASHHRTAEIQQWLERAWLAPIELPAQQARRQSAAVRATGDSDLALERDPQARFARLPKLAFETIRTGLTQGPVLIQVPRAGYLSALQCGKCRSAVRCPVCHGPVRMSVSRTATGQTKNLSCAWCARVVTDWACPVCGDRSLRAPVIGSKRTSEELGRAFPGHLVIDSSGDKIVDEVGDRPALVVATPGAEPEPSHGYAAAVLLDASLALSRVDLRASEEALRRWLNAVALVRPGADGGTVCVVGPPDDRAIQHLVRVDPAGFATRELADRREAGFPPAVTMIAIDGSSGVINELRSLIQLPEGATELGPVPLLGRGAEALRLDDEEVLRLLLRGPLASASELASTVKKATSVRSAHKKPGAARVIVDPAAM